MTGTASIDQENFRNILKRNISLPLGIGALSALIFVGLIFFLLSTLNWVDHTQRVIGNANETAKLSIDMETGMRGFLITGDETFLQPYEIARSRMMTELSGLREMVADNPAQVDRLQAHRGPADAVERVRARDHRPSAATSRTTSRTSGWAAARA